MMAQGVFFKFKLMMGPGNATMITTKLYRVFPSSSCHILFHVHLSGFSAIFDMANPGDCHAALYTLCFHLAACSDFLSFFFLLQYMCYYRNWLDAQSLAL